MCIRQQRVLGAGIGPRPPAGNAVHAAIGSLGLEENDLAPPSSLMQREMESSVDPMSVRRHSRHSCSENADVRRFSPWAGHFTTSIATSQHHAGHNGETVAVAVDRDCESVSILPQIWAFTGPLWPSLASSRAARLATF